MKPKDNTTTLFKKMIIQLVCAVLLLAAAVVPEVIIIITTPAGSAGLGNVIIAFMYMCVAIPLATGGIVLIFFGIGNMIKLRRLKSNFTPTGIATTD